MILEKALRYRKLCQTYQRYRFHMTSMQNSSSHILEEPVLEQMEWIKVN
jgi:hypothetical protein